MVKVRVLSRKTENFERQSRLENNRVFRNFDPLLHPFERAKEYQRAVNATKLDKVFAKPFLFHLDGHCDSVLQLATDPTRLTAVISGGADGEVVSWNLQDHCMNWKVRAHDGFCKGVAVNAQGSRVYSCGRDNMIRVWDLYPELDPDEEKPEIRPLQTFASKTRLAGLSWARNSDVFATGGEKVSLWTEFRSDPIHTFGWGGNAVGCVEYNLVQTNMLASAGSDRNIVFYDTREQKPMQRLRMTTLCNEIAWNPQEAMCFTLAMDDNRAYTYDFRWMNRARCVHLGHVRGVRSVHYAPSGHEIVTGGWDDTIRIYSVGHGACRELYHTKRMRRLNSVRFTGDARFILSGSNDCNVRVWKAQASMPLGTLAPAARRKLEYLNKLKDKFQHVGEVKRIGRHRHLPKWLKNRKDQDYIMLMSQKRKHNNRVKHSKPGTHEFPKMRELAQEGVDD